MNVAGPILILNAAISAAHSVARHAVPVRSRLSGSVPGRNSEVRWPPHREGARPLSSTETGGAGVLGGSEARHAGRTCQRENPAFVKLRASVSPPVLAMVVDD
jgi:hypothetical protein